MAAGDLNDPLSNIPNIVLVDQSAASAAPGAGYGRLEVVNGVLGVRVGTGAWVALASLVAGLLTALTEKVSPADTDLLLLQDEADSSALKKVQAGAIAGLGGSGSGLFDAYICVQDQKAQNTAGGTFTGGAWRTRDLNTEVADTAGIASVASNQITLAAGTYVCRITCPAMKVNINQARLYNITDGATIALGMSMIAGDTIYSTSQSVIVSRFTLAAQKVLEVQHYCTTGFNDYGFGYPNNLGTEVYTVAEFWREAG